jgi:hypothetical protein
MRSGCNLFERENYSVTTHIWCSAGHEDQASEVGGSLVAECTGSVDESGDSISLQSGSGER